MEDNFDLYKNKKVITIGIVSELTGLSIRAIRYYEERGLILPERSDKGNRKYSFSDVELLVNIAQKREDGIQTFEIKQELKKDKQKEDKRSIRNKMIQGQLNVHFRIQLAGNSK